MKLCHKRIILLILNSETFSIEILYTFKRHLDIVKILLDIKSPTRKASKLYVSVEFINFFS